MVLDVEGVRQGRTNGVVKAFAAASAMVLQCGPKASRQAQMEVVDRIGVANHGSSGENSVNEIVIDVLHQKRNGKE